ncbi:O-antigen/teichoic acid export membrane protein [Amorphus suaedae]
MSLGQYARNVGLLVGQSFVQRVLGMVTTIILARTLGAANFGIYSVVTATSNSVYGLVRLGVDASIHVHTAEGFNDTATRQRMRELLAAGFLMLLFAGALGGGGCLLFGERLAVAIYEKPELAVWIRVAGIAVLLQCLSQFFYATLVGLHRFADYVRVMVASAVLSVAAISLGALAAGLTGAVAALLAVQAVTVGWLGIAMQSALRKENLSLAFHNTAARTKSLLVFGFPFYVSGLISIPVVYVLQGMVVRHAGLEELGYLRAIMAFVSIVAFAPTSAAAAMISMFARTRAQEGGALAARILQNVRMILVFSLLVAAAVMVLLPWLIPLLFGAQYMPALGAASVALVTAVLTAVNGVVSNALLSARKVMLLFGITALQAIVFLGFGSYFIPSYGLTGYLTAELFGYMTAMVVMLLIATPWLRRNGVRLGQLIGAVPLFLLLAAGSVRLVALPGSPSPVESFVGSCIVLLSLLWAYRVILDPAERDVVRQMVEAGSARLWKRP